MYEVAIRALIENEPERAILYIRVESPAKTMNVIIPDSVLRFLALPLGGATQPAPREGRRYL